MTLATLLDQISKRPPAWSIGQALHSYLCVGGHKDLMRQIWGTHRDPSQTVTTHAQCRAWIHANLELDEEGRIMGLKPELAPPARPAVRYQMEEGR